MNVEGDPEPERGGAHTYRGDVTWEYAPEIDGDPDPGEIVWAWVSFEEDSSRGKDRPIAILGRADDHRLIGLMLSSRERTGDRDWLAIGSGPWDSEGRPSWLRRDRLLAVRADAVRREGAVLPRATYDAVLAAVGTPTPAVATPHAWTLRDGFRRILGRPLP
ncbi:MAG: type II toxin-antitoxin system PemK/MazF family toxin [Candidatus Nanopelagicales bacterium]